VLVQAQDVDRVEFGGQGSRSRTASRYPPRRSSTTRSPASRRPP